MTSQMRMPGTDRWIARLPLIMAGLFVAMFVGLPIAAMVFDTLWSEDGFTLSAYGTILEDEVDRAQLWYSIQLGCTSTLLASVLGFGFAWLTYRTDMPLARLLGPLGIAPLVIPAVLVAMGFADLVDDASGFWLCAGLLGVCYAPFVAVMTARGLASIDGRLYEAALVTRGRLVADRTLVRMILPEVLAGCLFAFIFVISEHGVPEFLTVRGKTWHTYAEGVFARWTRRATGMSHEDLVSPVVAAVPLIAIISLALFVALRLRARRSIGGDFRPLPQRLLGSWRWPALLLPFVYLGCGVVLPVVVMVRWAAGSTQVNEPMSVDILRESFRSAIDQAGGDLTYTLTIGAVTTVLLLAVCLPLSRRAARKQPLIDYLSVLPVAVPAVLLGIGIVKIYNAPWLGAVYDATGDFYDSWGVVACAYAARFLPFGILTLSHAVRRIDPALDEAALLSGRGAFVRTTRVYLPLILPAAWSAGCLIFILALRELDVAVVLPASNGTVVRRLSNIVHFGGENTGGALALLLLLAACLIPLLTVVITGRKLRAIS